MKHDNEEAASGIFTLVLIFLLASVLFIVIGYGIDRFTLISSTMFSGSAATQLRFDTVNIMVAAFRVEPFILLIAAGMNYWMQEMRQYTGMADVGTMIMATVEMITMTMVAIAFTLFGGYGLDTVINFVNNYTFANPDLSLFAAVQYLAPMFYGIMFLILIGIIIQFIITCIQTTDYSQMTY
jgi:hypothetical protein